MKKTFLTTILLLAMAPAPVLAQIGPETPYIRDFKTSTNSVQARVKLNTITKAGGLNVTVPAFTTILRDGKVYSFNGGTVAMTDNATRYLGIDMFSNGFIQEANPTPHNDNLHLAKITTLNGQVTVLDQLWNAPIDYRLSQLVIYTMMIYADLPELRGSADFPAVMQPNFVVFVLGRVSKGDGFGGLFYWDSTSTAADNDVSVIKLDSFATGRFIKWL